MHFSTIRVVYSSNPCTVASVMQPARNYSGPSAVANCFLKGRVQESWSYQCDCLVDWLPGLQEGINSEVPLYMLNMNDGHLCCQNQTTYELLRVLLQLYG